MTRTSAVFALLVPALLAGCAAPRGPSSELPPTQAETPPPLPEAGRPPLSPRDTARTRIAGAVVFVDYGRPFMRGRVIMGELVPYDQVWRTGANAATTLVTEADLRIGDVEVPRGTYTLYTLPSRDQWQLIVNRQTGQWGTQYDPAQDLARIPLRRSELAAPVEQFTIQFEPAGAGEAALALEWENTRLTVPVRVVSSGG